MTRFEQFREGLRRHAAVPCIEEHGQMHTYGALLKEADHWDAVLNDLGHEPGTVIGLRADYSLAAIGALLALLSRRALVALIPRDGQPAHYLSAAHATARLDVTNDGGFSWRRQSTPERHPLIERLRNAQESGIVIFTSGSTGRPKAALQSLERFLHKYERPGRGMRTLAFLLFDHIAGQDTLFYTLANGGTLVLTKRRDPLAILELIESHRVEVLPASPSFLRLLCALGSQAEHDLSCLKIITYGSEPMDPTTLARLNERFPAAQITQKYGTTETGSPRSVSRSNDSLWMKIKGGEGVQTKVVDGVLFIRSEGTILGYLNAPSPVDAEGWYCTGDLVDVDGEWIRFRGRTADTIKVGGEKVAPAEVEQTLLELELVRDAVVTGEPHPLMGEVVAARVVLNTPMDHHAAVQQLREHCRRRLIPHKVPVRIEIVTDSLTTERQKARRKQVAD